MTPVKQVEVNTGPADRVDRTDGRPDVDLRGTPS
jgi:hypothetical protein